MGDVVNLNRYRKQKLKAERERRASEKRARFGLPDRERAKNSAERALEARRLDGARRDEPGSDGRD
ncbi:MAG: DUF4169 family protein [Hyphomicrobiaceae bacterium]|nr:DUF4169 family protein [Hyphomicrobiaceae bacterium]